MATIEQKLDYLLSQVSEMKELLLKYNESGSKLPLKEYYTVKEALERLGLSRTTFDRRVSSGKIQVKKVFGRVMVVSSSVDNYV